jgi:hypothetical protein
MRRINDHEQGGMINRMDSKELADLELMTCCCIAKTDILYRNKWDNSITLPK